MGTVWQAHDEVLRVDVALKEIRFPADLDAAERVAQVDAAMREARTAARLRSNPHVVTVHDAVEHDGLPWIVMEYVPADTLAATVERHGPLTVARVADIGLAVLDALVAGQRLGVLHRDVKPSNILLARDGRVLLTDFGIATQSSDPTVPDCSARVDDGPLVVAAVQRLLSRGGTPAYSAPERLVNGTATLSGDLFSLGASLYFAVEGHSPFGREDLPSTVGAVVGAEPPEFVRAGPLAHPIAGLLAKTPATRLGAEGAQTLLRWAGAVPGADPASGFPSVSGSDSVPGSDSVSGSVEASTGTSASTGVPVMTGGSVGPASGTDSRARPGSGRWLLVVALVVAALVAGGIQLFAAFGPGSHVARQAPSTTATPAPAVTPTPAATRAPMVTPVPGSVSTVVTVPPGMIGKWQGMVRQGPITFPLTVTLQAGRGGETVGTARNPRDGCTSDLQLISTGADDDPSNHEVPTGADGHSVTSARFHERLTNGSLSCTAVDVDVMTVLPDGTLDLSYSASLLTSSGHAVLRREKT